MKSPKRHHYLPQFYLEGFCRDGGVWIFDRERTEFRQQTPVNTALKSHYYSVQDVEGNRRTEIESFLSQIEGQGKHVIAKLLSRETISSDERETLAIFIGFMMTRVPDFEKSVNAVQQHMISRVADFLFSDEGSVKATMDQRERDTGKKSDISAKDLVEFHKSGQYDIVIHRNESLRLMLSLSTDLANYFRQMDWSIFHALGKSSFITTDNPVILLPPRDHKPVFYGVGIITRGALKIFPLSLTACLIMYDNGKLTTHREADQQAVRSINLTVATQADRFVIGRDEALVRNVVETTRLREWKRAGRFSVG